MNRNKTDSMNEIPVKGLRLGKAPMRSDTRMLNLANFLKADIKVPEVFEPWKKRSTFPLRTFGNNEHGCCTRASQALLQMRLERIEGRRTINVTDEELLRVYYEMTAKYYGGGDTGAFEMDALSCWRREDSTFKDVKGRPYTIDAFTRINQFQIDEVKKALFLGQSKGIKVCFNLPLAWSNIPGGTWDIPEGQPAIGEYLPGSWGGHSTTGVGYNTKGVILLNSWGFKEQLVTWRAYATYSDENYLPVDSVNAWKKNKEINKLIDLSNLKASVNKVSSVQI